MLEFNYSERLDSLIHNLDWHIQLPPDWVNFFEESGTCSSMASDERNNSRMRIRTRAVLRWETSLPSVPRGPEPVGVYIKDFSRRGCGLISPIQFYPEETVRILLATFWIRLKVVRVRHVGPSCYEIGLKLIEQNQPGPEAFAVCTGTATHESVTDVAGLPSNSP